MGIQNSHWLGRVLPSHEPRHTIGPSSVYTIRREKYVFKRRAQSVEARDDAGAQGERRLTTDWSSVPHTRPPPHPPRTKLLGRIGLGVCVEDSDEEGMLELEPDTLESAQMFRDCKMVKE